MKTVFQEVASLLEEAVRERTFSGASILISFRGEVLFEKVAGRTSWDLDGLTGKPVKPDTLFDLASLTKPLVTARLVARAVQSGEVFLDDPIGRFLGDLLPSDKKSITLRLLLNHASGLPDWKPYFADLVRTPETAIEKDGWTANKRKVYERIHGEASVYSAGTRHLYSDPGFILLGEVLEMTGGLRLDEQFRLHITEPLQIPDLFFMPNGTGLTGTGTGTTGCARQFMATEKAPPRNRYLVGEVHDDNAYAMGGVAGHAGLFGTARSVFSAFSEWRSAFRQCGSGLAPAVAREFAEREKFQGEFGLGWMFPSSPSSSGSLFSRKSFGHLGFTGTSIWYDPDADLGVVFLTNRVHPTRENDRLKALRPLLHDRIYRCVIEKA